MKMKCLFLGLIILGIFCEVYSQSIDHWETIIYNSDLWSYAIGSSDISQEWVEPDYDDSGWLKARGGFGYGDGDDNTFLNNVSSLFIRKEFVVEDLALLDALILHADFDDGFVAYLNGVEIARANLGTVGERVSYDLTATTFTEPRLVFGLLPFAFDINKNILEEGKNVLAIQIHNSGNTSSDFTSNFFLSVGIVDDSSLYGELPSWFSQSLFDSNLPIVKIVTAIDEQIQDDPRISAHMGIINNGTDKNNSQIDPYNDYDGLVAIEIRGTSSSGFEKKSYGFETQNEDGSNNNVEILGLPEENDWILHGPYSDKSLLRNDFTFYLGELTGRYVPRTRLCELFINDNYEGVYVMMEKIKQDKNRVDIAKLTIDDNEGDELTGGYIVQVDRNVQDIPGVGWTSNYPDFKFFKYVEPQAEDITDAQAEYISSYLDEFEAAMFSDNYEELYLDYINVESFVDYFIVTEIGKHIDAYKLSFYMYKDKDSNGGKLHFGPLWDFNLGYGNFDFACSPDPDGWAYEFRDCGPWHPFWAQKLADIPNVQHLINCRWNELRAGAFSSDSLNTYINDKVSEMGLAVDRNFERWQVLGQYLWPNSFVGDTYTDELEFMSSWLDQRFKWLDDNMVGDCDQFVSKVDEVNTESIKMFPNPNNGQFRISTTIAEPALLQIYNVENQMVFEQKKINNINTEVNVTHLPNGFYTLILKSKKSNAILSKSKLTIVE